MRGLQAIMTVAVVITTFLISFCPSDALSQQPATVGIGAAAPVDIYNLKNPLGERPFALSGTAASSFNITFGPADTGFRGLIDRWWPVVMWAATAVSIIGVISFFFAVATRVFMSPGRPDWSWVPAWGVITFIGLSLWAYPTFFVVKGDKSVASGLSVIEQLRRDDSTVGE